MRVSIKFRKYNISMLIEVITLSPSSTYQLITRQNSGTMRIPLMGKEHSKVKDLGRIFNKTMLHLGSNNNNNIKRS